MLPLYGVGLLKSMRDAFARGFRRKSQASRAETQTDLQCEPLEERQLLANFVWTGAVNSNWTDAGNWINQSTMTANGTPDDSTDIAIFDNASNTTVNVNMAQTVGGVLFSDFNGVSGVSNFTLSGQSITIVNGSLQQAATSSNTINAVIDGATGSITVSSGTLTIGTTNTYAGGTTQNGGTIILSSTTSTFGTGTLTLNGGTLRSSANTTGGDRNIANEVIIGGNITLGSTTQTGVLRFSGGVTLTNDRTITTNSAVVFNGAIDDGGNHFGFTKAGGNVLVLGTANTFDGQIIVTAGTLRVSADAQFGDTPGAFVADAIVVTGGTIEFTSSFTMNANRGITIGSPTGTGTASLDVNSGVTLTYNGVISDNGTGADNLHKVDTGTLVLGGANTYSGATNVLAGTLVATNAAAFGTLDAGVYVWSGATLRFDASGGAMTVAESIYLGGNGVSNAGALQSNGNDVTLNGAVFLTGDTRISSNTANRALTLNGPFVKGASASVTFAGAGNTVVNSAIGDSSYSLSTVTARAVTPGQAIGDATIINNVLNGTLAATATTPLNGPITFGNLAAFNSFFGTALTDNFITVYEMTLTVLVAGEYSFSVTGNDDGGAVWIKPTGQAAFLQADRLMPLGPGLVTDVVANGNTTIGTKYLTAGTYTLVYAHREISGNESFTARIAGPGLEGANNALVMGITNPAPADATRVTKVGSGTLTLAGANTYTGITEVQAGTVRVTGAGTLGASAGDTVVLSGAVVEFAGVTGGTYSLAENILLQTDATFRNSVSNLNFLGSISATSAADPTYGGGVRMTIDSATAGTTLTIQNDVHIGAATATFTGSGDTIVNGNIISSVGGSLMAGLSEGFLSAAFNETGTATVSGVTLGVRTGQLTTAPPWADNRTYVYTGQFYDADGIFAFAENIDDSVLIKIEGVTLLRNTNYDVATTTASTTGLRTLNGTEGTLVTSANSSTATGIDFKYLDTDNDNWYTIEIRIGNGTGNAGPAGQISGGVDTGWFLTSGFGLNSAPTPGFTSANGVDYIAPTDPGNATLFRTTTTSANGAVTKSGTGTLRLNGNNTYSGATTVSAGTLDLNYASGNNIANSVSITVAAGATLDVLGLTGGELDLATGQTLAGGGATVGTVLGAIDATVTSVISPGTTVGGAGILATGNVQMDGDTTFIVDVNSTYIIAGTHYDQLSVTGTVVLNGANLVLQGGAVAPPNGTVLVIIDNDGTDAVTGTFNGLANGASVTVGSATFNIYYNGGTGNDVVLIATGGTNSAPTTVYVEDDAWSSLSVGDFILDADFEAAGNQNAIFGVNAFSDIPAAVGALAGTGTIIINGGTYTALNLSTKVATVRLVRDASESDPALVSVTSLVGDTTDTVSLGGFDAAHTTPMTLSVANTASNTFAGILNGTGGLTKSGAGLLLLSGNNAFTGSVLVAQGTLEIGGTAGDISEVSSVTVGSSGQTATLLVSRNATHTLPTVTLGNGGTGTLLVTNGTVNVASIVDTGTTALYVDRGTMNVTNGVTADDLRVGYATTNYPGTGTLNVLGGSVVIGTGGSTQFLLVGTRLDNTTNSATGVLNLSAASSVSIDVQSIFVGTLTQNGTGTTQGTITLSSGGTNTVRADSLLMGDSPQAGQTGFTSSIGLGSGINNFHINTMTIGGQKSIASVALAAGGTLNIRGRDGVSAASKLTIGANTASGTGTVGVGTLDASLGTLNALIDDLTIGQFGTGGGSATGNLTLNAGTVEARTITLGTVAGAIGNLYLNGGTLKFETLTTTGGVDNFDWSGGTIQNIATTNLSVNANVELDLLTSATHTFLVDANQTATVNSLLVGSGDLTKSGAGLLQLNGASTAYTGAINVSAGTLQLGNASASGTTAGGVIVSSGATLDLNGQAIGAEPISVTGTGVGGFGAIVNSSLINASLAGTVTTNSFAVGGNGNITFSGAVQGTGGLTKVGSNSVTLSNTNSYSGTTTVTTGTLALANGGSNNTIASSPSITVDIGGTLDVTALSAGRLDLANGQSLAGSGIIYGVLTAASGSSVSPGLAGPGAMTLDNPSNTANFTLNAGASFVVELNGTASTLFDRLSVDGIVTLGGALSATLGTGFTPPANSTYVIISNDGIDPVVGFFSNAPSNGAEVTISGRKFLVFYNSGDGNDVVLVEANTAPSTIYVNDDWSLAAGTLIADADFGTNGNQAAIYGVNAFNTIAAALAALPAGSGTIIVNGGVYAESVSLTGTRTLEITGPDLAQNVIINSLTTAAGTSVILEGASVLAIGMDNSNATLAGMISGSGSLTKQGSGTVNVTGSASYTGTTTVSAGTLLVTTGGSLLGSSNLAIDAGTFQVINGASVNVGSVTNLAGVGNLLMDEGTMTVLSGLNVDTLRVGNMDTNSGTSNLTVQGGAVVIGSGSGIFDVGVRSIALPSNQATHTATANFAAASSVTINVGQVRMGVITGNLTNEGGVAGNLILSTAGNNSITATTSVVMSSSSDRGNAFLSTLTLGGASNEINTALLTVGGLKGAGRIINPNNGSLRIRGATGGTTRANVDIAVSADGTGVNGTGSLTMGTGSIDAMIGALRIGKQNTGGGSATGVLSFGAGAVMANTIVLGDGSRGSGTINQTGGELQFNTLTRPATSLLADYNWSGGTIRNQSGQTTMTVTNVAVDLLSAATHTVMLDTGVTLTFAASSVLTDVGPLVKTGGGNLVLNGNSSSYSGLITIDEGRITAGANFALGATSAGTIVNGSAVGSTLAISGAGLDIAENVTLNSNTLGRAQLLAVTGANIWSGNIQVSTTTAGNHVQIASDGTSALNITGDITGSLVTDAFLLLRGTSTNSGNMINGSVNLGAGSLAKTDAGTWTVGALGESYVWGDTVVGLGTLRMGAANVLPSATTVVMGQAGTGNAILDLNGFSQTIAGLTDPVAGTTNTVTNSSATAATLTVDTSGSVTYGTSGGALTGNLTLAKLGTGTLTLSGASTYTGPTLIQNGILQLAGGANRLPVGTVVVLGSGTNSGRLDLNNQSQTIVDLQTSGTGTLNRVIDSTADATIPVLTLNIGTGQTVTLANVLGIAGQNGFGLTKTGAGTLVMAGSTDTYTGPTVVAAGTLRLGADNALPITTALTVGTGATAGTFDLAAFSQTVGTLAVSTNGAAMNTITVNGGEILTVNGAVNIGSAGVGRTTNLTVNGAGTFRINNTGANVEIGLGNTDQNGTTSTAFVDMSALGALEANVNQFRVGFDSRINATFLMSNTSNTITATTLSIGNSNGDNASPVSVTLGSGVNIFNANTIHIGLSKSSNTTVAFASQAAGSPGTLTVRGTAGGTSTANMIIGSDNGTGTAATATGVLDLRGHVVDVRLGSLNLGVSNQTSSGGGRGTLHFDAGTFSVTTLNLGTKSNSGGGTATGNLNIGGGTFTVNATGQFRLGSQTGSGSSVATVNITGGTVISNVDITTGTGTTTATLTLNGGVLDMTSHGIGSGASPMDIVNFQSGTLQNLTQFNGGAELVKTTAGTLTLAGVNSYTGDTIIDDGTLVVSGVIDSTVMIRGGVLEGTGSILGDVVMDATGLGVSPGGLGVGTLTVTGDVVTFDASGTYRVDLTGGGNDSLLLNNATGVTLSLNNILLDVQLATGFTPTTGTAFVIVNKLAGGIAMGTFRDSSGNPLIDGDTILIGGLAFEIDYQYDAATSTPGAGNDIALIVDASPIFTGTNADEDYRLFLQGGDVMLGVSTEGGAEVVTNLGAQSALASVTIRALGGDDSLTIDYSGGDPIANVIVNFDGGTGFEDGVNEDNMAPGDTIRLINGSATSVDYTLTNLGGSILIDLTGTSAGTVIFTNLEDTRPIEDDLTILAGGGRTFLLTTAGESATLSDPDGADGDNRLDSNTSASWAIDFTASPNLSIHANGGSTTLTIAGTEAGFATNAAFTADSIVLTASTLETAGSQTYTGAVVLGTDVTLSASAILFDAPVDSDGTARSLTLNSSGNVQFLDDVGALSALNSLLTDAAGQTVLASGVSISTVADQTYNDLLVLNGPATLTSQSGSVIVNAGVNGNTADSDLIVNGDLQLNSGFTAVNSLTVNGTATLNTPSVTTTAGQLYNGAVTLAQGVTIQAGSDVTFASTVDAASATTAGLVVNTAGVTTFGGAVGSIVALDSLVTDAGGSVVIGANITTLGDQTFNDAAFVAGAATLAGTNITFQSTVDDDATPGFGSLTITASGITHFAAAVGSNSPLLSILVNGGGTTQMFGGTVTTLATQTYNDAVVLGADTIITSTAAFFFNSITGGGYDLTLNTSARAVLGGVVSGVDVLTTDAGGDLVIDTTSISVNTLAVNDAVLLAQDVTFNVTGSALFANVINSEAGETNDLLLTAASVAFGGDIGLASDAALGVLSVVVDQTLSLGVNILTSSDINLNVNSGSLLIGSNATVQSLNGNVQIDVANDLILAAGTQLLAQGDIQLSADLTGDPGTGANMLIDGQIISQSGSIFITTGDDADTIRYNDLRSGTVTLIMNTAGGNDVVNIVGTPASGTAVVNTGAGDDTVTLGSDTASLDTVQLALTVVGESGQDVLNLNDSGDVSNNSYLLTSSTFDQNNSGLPLVTYIGIEELNLNTGAGADAVLIASTSANGLVNLSTGGGNDAVTVQETGTGSVLNVSTGAGNDTVALGNASGVVNSIAGRVNLDAGAGVDALVLNDSGDTSDNVGFLSANTISGLGLGDAVSYAGFESVQAVLGSGNDRLTVSSTAAGALTNIETGLGDDTLALAVDNLGPVVATVTDQGGSDTLDFDLSLATTIDLDVTSQQMINARGDRLTMVTPFENLIGSPFADTVHVDPLLGVSRSIQGRSPVASGVPDLNGNDSSGDRLFLEAFGNGFAMPRFGGDGSFTAEDGNGGMFGTISFTSIEQVTIEDQLNLRGLPNNPILTNSGNPFVLVLVGDTGSSDSFSSQEILESTDGRNIERDSRGRNRVRLGSDLVVVIGQMVDGKFEAAGTVSGASLDELLAKLAEVELPAGPYLLQVQIGDAQFMAPIQKDTDGEFSEADVEEAQQAIEDAAEAMGVELPGEADEDADAEMGLTTATAAMTLAAAIGTSFRRTQRRGRDNAWPAQLDRFMERFGEN